MEPTDHLKEQARQLGFDLVGVCEPGKPPHLEEYVAWLAHGSHGSMGYLETQLPLKSDPLHLLPSARSIIAVGLNYNQDPETRPDHPKIARYALGRDYHKVIRGKLKRLTGWIEANHPEAETRACVDSAPIFERDYANLAGLGWFGKNTMLINSQRGSWFFIGLLLTSVEFQPDAPAVGGCGTCRKCIDACPTGAIVQRDSRWQVDARRCISYLTIEHAGEIEPDLSREVGTWTFGCDVCQEVCPFNAVRESQPLRAMTTRERDFLNRRQWPSLRDLVEISSEDWDGLTQGSAVRRTGIKGLRRNARINLDNQD
ncbi:MAG: tRNA epoxyqueuosine(34) reductase QueG [Armatimonadetes bacterium 55-13]|nr:tRNA epoxyqueuosine(34) reductase QueG [Armatimonadota bacterium]OJU61563.1 MAG: tRNA epoxyqueuosine(34) reductase QueG [Armatimonadetes bacterium 55-13]